MPPRIRRTLPQTKLKSQHVLQGITLDIIQEEEQLLLKIAQGPLCSPPAILALAMVSINILLCHRLLPSGLQMREQVMKFRVSQTSHGKQKLRMLVDLLGGKHHPLLLAEEKRVDTSRARPENNAARKRVPSLFDLSDYSR
jgi:hypothetical protein